jgi:(1->4)-alpha-D-glucan 1-alpha-D-glucosylmutase
MTKTQSLGVKIDSLLTIHPWTATYRVQLNAGFRFDDLAAVAPYLAELGISHVYLSPLLQAAPGSTHGYDGADPTRLSSELGGAEAYERACEALELHGLGQLVDIVPNHLAATYENPWWRDVLRHGIESAYARYFDLRWRGSPPRIRLPVLGGKLDDAVRAGEVKLESRAGGEVVARYYDAIFPLAPETAPGASQLDAVSREPEALLALLQRQHYELVDWRTAAREIDYRRFFNINGLVGLRVEDEAVFRDSHRLILQLVHDGRVAGLRVDHIDGLRDPAAYLEHLQRATGDAPIYVEKILEDGEQLPEGWPVRGTTGYDFLNAVNGLFVDDGGEAELDRLYREFTSETVSYDEVLEDKKRFVLDRLIGGDLSHLAGLFVAACEDAAGCPKDDIADVLRETIVALPVYRTYIQPERDEISETDRRQIEKAVTGAAKRLGGVDAWLFEALRDVLLLRRRGLAESEFVLAFQQLTGPAMAKGAEDTAFYCYNRLASLNEVGGDPGRFGVPPATFHALCARNAERWPRTLLTTSTHDTKRGEDVRLRIDAISELTQEWLALVARWGQAHERYRRGGLPDRNATYLLYQTLAGAWPLDEARAWEYTLKAAHEAKTYTSWIEPDEAYESALRSFVSALLNDVTFRDECAAFAARLDVIARTTSLSQTLLKLTAPGVPDFYQGTELWQLSLVDPDNRRLVDYELRRRLLDQAKRMSAAEVLRENDSGLPKLWLIWKTLSLRRQRPELFDGAYEPVYASGARGDCVVALRRGERLIAVVPRLVSRLGDGWDDTSLTLPEGAWRNWLTGAEIGRGDVPAGELLRDFPVALLVRGEAA